MWRETLVDQHLVEEQVAHLANHANARPAADFPWDADALSHPGLYSWWADEEARILLGEPLGLLLPPLIYAGQAGASSKVAGIERGATLLKRIGRNHLNGNIGSSTFRRTLTAILRRPLGLTIETRRRLTAESNQVMSDWMRAHLSLATAPCDDRTTLAHVEEAVLARLDPPLNLQGMSATPVRRRLKDLRRELSMASAPPVS